MIKILIAAYAVLLSTARADDARFLRAISQIESGDNDSAIGKCGARGRYQISNAVWRTQANAKWSFDLAFEKSYSTIVALRHVKWLKEQQIQSGRYNLEYGTSYYFLACAWKCGPKFYDRKESLTEYKSRTSYAYRVLNLMKSFENEQATNE